VEWRPDPRVTLRLAAFETRKPCLISNQTLEPTQIVGTSQFYDDLNGTRATGYGASVDIRATSRLAVGISLQRRKLSFPFLDISDIGELQEEIDGAEELQASTYASLILGPRLVAHAMLTAERWSYDAERPLFPEELETLRAPLTLGYYVPSGLFASTTLTGVAQEKIDVAGQSAQDSFATIDAAIGYRFPDARGGVVLEVSNLLDESFKYEDDNFRSTIRQRADLLPERMVLVRAVVNF
jgi:hypothetical protein